MTHRIVCVIPVYNHPHYLVELMAYISTLSLPIIVVNDGSNAQTSSVLTSLAQQYPHLTLVEHSHNMGKGQAVMTGLKQAQKMGYSHALQLDSDGQHDWSDIPKFINCSEQHPNDVVIGSPIFDETVPKGRLYGRYATHIWVWINSLSLQIKDSMCGFRVYPLAPTLQIIHSIKLPQRMGFDSEILVRLCWAGLDFRNIETAVIYPEDGISHFRAWEDNWILTKMHSKLFVGMLVRFPKLVTQRLKGRD
ncbi:glycosyltransferase family 2 protein [Acinetobacter sp. MD2(2019)]|uniref:glycosyltransferase family 2 protein n=1 Tax=Acinetobacter sp. MD2(2019) TaxID=2605273 RepID=UPI002D1EF7BC|nr:glycosyltransferase family 2 protein [Acinetobacter sp. MD2(2019)]MEB3753606.1 glycosyltransferase family 2 protein [Acinetobacter sp. MD2(2019)]